jgi:hypothetical protein
VSCSTVRALRVFGLCEGLQSNTDWAILDAPVVELALNEPWAGGRVSEEAGWVKAAVTSCRGT